ncbi:MAG TPA: glycosyltransferase family 1 protein [Ramlibacter sp.]
MQVQPLVYFDPRWSGNHGIGRFSAELQARLPGVVPLRIAGPKLSLYDPLASSLALAGLRQGCFLSPGFNPPLRSPIPFAFTIHDLVHLRVPAESSALRRLYYASIVRPATRRAWRVLTVSEHSRRDILEWAGLPPEAVHVVGNGVSPVFVPAAGGRAARAAYLLHVGRRAGHKNIGMLLRAFAASRSSRALRLVFTGEPDDATRAMAAEAGIAGRVDFAGPVDDPALLALYQRAVALVFPSLHEGFGLPIVEAMATGTPVVTSSATSMPEVAGAGNALLVDPHDCDALAAAIDRVVEDEPLWNELSARGLVRARAFSWEQVGARVCAALDLPAQ